MNSFISTAYFAYNYLPIVYTLYTYTSPITIPLKLSSYLYKRMYPDKKEYIIIELKQKDENKDLEEEFTIVSKTKF